MHSKSIIAAAILAGASAVAAYEHPTFAGHGHGRNGHGGPNPCKTTSTVIVYATETSTVYEGYEGGHPTYGGGAPAGPSTVTVTVSATEAAGGSGGGKPTWAEGYTSTSTTSNGATKAGPTATGTPPAPSALCLTNATAAYLVNGYGQLLSAYTNATAHSLLAADFTDTSDSINWLAGIPLGGCTFASKDAFIGGQGTQPPIGFSVTSIFYSCTQVAFRWTATVGLKKFPAKGINTFTASNLNNSAAGWQIQSMFSEFNVGAWQVDIGRTCSPQGANIAGSA